MCERFIKICHLLVLLLSTTLAAIVDDSWPQQLAEDAQQTSTNIVDSWLLEKHTNDTSAEELAALARSRINGGQPVTQIIPYQVSLQSRRRGQWQHFCAGSIISASHVLTAAHCLRRMTTNAITVLGGTLNWRNGGDRHQVQAMRMHPNFTSNTLITNDVGILKVKPPFNLQKSTIATISLGGAGRVADNTPVRLTGWGAMTATGSSGIPEQLQRLDYRTISNAECARKGFRVTKNELCALAEKGKGACVGDSGGPLVTTNGTPQLVGVVSFGTATCAAGRPDVYARVSSFLPYINKVITSEIP